MRYAYGRNTMAWRRNCLPVVGFSALCVLINFCAISGQLLLEPAGDLYVCIGGGMRIRCSTSTAAVLLEWNVTVPGSNPFQTEKKSFQRGNNPVTDKAITVNSAILNMSLTRSFPLVSEIFTDNAIADLNGILITCTEYTSLIDTDGTSASTGIILIRNDSGNVNISPNVNISEEFEADGVRVTLEWTHTNGVSYAIRVDPEVNVSYSWRQSAQLVVPYNTKYNISVVASLCGNSRAVFIIINYARCPEVMIDSPVRVTGYRDPALVGTTVMFSCSTKLTLTGSSMSTCMEDGEWEPDLKGIKCKVDCSIPMVSSNVSLNYSSTLEDSQLTFQCEDGLFPDGLFSSRCYRNGSWIPNPSGHVCGSSSAANCGDPPPPSDGYLEPYTSTSEGARVNRVYICQNGQVETEEIVCNSDGQWEVSRSNACTIKPSSLKPDTNVIIGASLGSLFGVVTVGSCCGVLIVFIIIKWKGLKRRNIPVSQNYTIRSTESTDLDQGEYSLLQHSAPVITDKKNNSIGEYSLIQLSDVEKQLKTNSEDQPTTLVYADVMSFKQNSHVPLCNPTENRVEYAQLKGYTGKLDLESPDKTHSIDQTINLDILLIQLKPAVTDKWYKFGEAIGVNKKLLETCTRYPSDQSLVEILDNWLRNHSGQPTWNEIAEALTEIGLKELAYKIERVYETGTLPIEVDMNTLPEVPSHEPAEEPPPPIPPREY